MKTRIAFLLISSILLSPAVPAAAQESSPQLMENERMRDGRPKVEPTSPQAVCQRPSPPPTLPAMPEFEQLEAAQPQLQAHIGEVESFLECLNGRIHATADPEARAITRGQYYQAEREVIDVIRSMKILYVKNTERVGGKRSAPEPASLQFWVWGRPHPEHANLVAGPVPGYWSPAPGYRWRNEKQMTVEWQQGLPHPLQATVVAGPSAGTWHVNGGTGMVFSVQRVGERVMPCIDAVTPGTPAERAGVRVGSCILRINGTMMIADPDEANALRTQVLSLMLGEPGTTLEIRFVDNDEVTTMRLQRGRYVVTHVPSVREAGEQGYCAALEKAVERVQTDFNSLKGQVVGTGLTVFDGRNSAYTKTMHTPTFDLHPGNCQVWDLDDPAYADEYACHWQAASLEAIDRTWQSLHGLVAACLAPEQYSCYTTPARQNRRTMCQTPRVSGRPYLRWAQGAGNASGEVVLYNELRISVVP